MESAIGKALSFGGNVGRSIKKVRRRPEEPPDSDSQKEEDFELVVKDARKMIVDGILTITFSNRCGRFGHNRENCPHKTGQGSASEVEVNQQLNQGLRMQRRVEKEEFGPWMLVERKQRRKSRSTRGRNGITDDGAIGGSRFGVLNGNYRGEFWKQLNDLNGNNGSRILGK
ncbi:hypothetical protein Goarm_021603, partial [Gossypium armourianum]|nr:hypothetical protein [Gossypium armourianum]